LTKPLGSLADGWLAVHAVQCQHRLLRAGRCRDRHPPTPPRHATELINNGVSIEADAVLGLTARIQRFGGYATDEVALAPEPFDARHHWSGSSLSIWSESLSALGTLEEVERGRRETVVLSDR
jgi:hypothetical protein